MYMNSPSRNDKTSELHIKKLIYKEDDVGKYFKIEYGREKDEKLQTKITKIVNANSVQEFSLDFKKKSFLNNSDTLIIPLETLKDTIALGTDASLMIDYILKSGFHIGIENDSKEKGGKKLIIRENVESYGII